MTVVKGLIFFFFSLSAPYHKLFTGTQQKATSPPLKLGRTLSVLQRVGGLKAERSEFKIQASPLLTMSFLKKKKTT